MAAKRGAGAGLRRPKGVALARNGADDVEHLGVLPVRQERSRQALERLLRTAESLLRREGLEALTIPAVAAEAGVSTGGVYRRFENKGALLRALHEQWCRWIEQSLTARIAAAPRPLAALVETVADWFAEFNESEGAIFEAFVRASSSDPQIEARAAATHAHVFAAFHDAALARRSEIPNPDPELAISTAYRILSSILLARRFPLTKGAAWKVLATEAARAAVGYLTGPQTTTAYRQDLL